MTVEARHLRSFLAIAEAGSITRAATLLHVTQPALSRTLRQLEQHLGVPLVARSTHHLELTRAGRAYAIRAQAALAGLDNALDPAQVEAGPLRVGHAWAALGRRTALLLREWSTRRPDVQLDLPRVNERLAGLGTGAVHLAILRAPGPLRAYATRVLFHDPRMAVVSAESALAQRDSLSLADLAGEVVATNPISGTTRLDLWPVETRPARTIETPDTDEWLVTIASGRAVGVSGASTAEVHAFPGVRYVPLADAPDLPVVLAWPDPPTHPAALEFVDVAAEVASAD
jgi:DNA-binding transcriptional LysR family regulator